MVKYVLFLLVPNGVPMEGRGLEPTTEIVCLNSENVLLLKVYLVKMSYLNLLASDVKNVDFNFGLLSHCSVNLLNICQMIIRKQRHCH